MIIVSGQGLNEALIMEGITDKRYEKIWVCLELLIKSAHNGYRDQVMGILSIKKKFPGLSTGNSCTVNIKINGYSRTFFNLQVNLIFTWYPQTICTLKRLNIDAQIKSDHIRYWDQVIWIISIQTKVPSAGK